MSHLDREALRAAIQRKDAKVLKWYVEHLTEMGSAIVGPEDAEARMLYYQLRLQQHTTAAPRPTGSTSVMMEHAPPHRADAAYGLTLHTPSLRQVAFQNAVTPLSRAPASHTPIMSAEMVETHPLAAHHVLPADRSSVTAAGGTPREEHPVKVHHSFSRRLFRGYGAYINDGETPTTSAAPYKPSAAPGAASSWTQEWDTFSPSQQFHRDGGPGAGIASPKADTSTFLLHHVGSVVASPRTLTLTRKNFDLHEDEERVDIAQLEAYEWKQILLLRRDDHYRTLGFVHRQQAVTLGTVEAKERLDISAAYAEITASMLHAWQRWQNGPSKMQNGLLVNEIILRSRILAEEAQARLELDTVQRKAAEHQLSDLRRLKWLEHEHERAAEMHMVMIAALSHQGVDVSRSAASASKSPEQAAAHTFGQDWVPSRSLHQSRARDFNFASSPFATPQHAPHQHHRGHFGAPPHTTARGSSGIEHPAACHVQ